MRNGHEIARLIEPGRVHRSVYTDLELFELEMERIFGRAWLFVGHDRLALAAAMDRQAGLCLSRLQS